jgi:hypothetical protein
MAAPNARAARERKQRIFVAVGGLVLLALLAFQLPKLLGGSGSSAAPPAAETAVGGETEPGTQEGIATPAGLTDTDRPLDLGPGQFRSFSVFQQKDPFVQQIVAPEPTEIPSSTSRAASTSKKRPAATRPKAPSKRFSVGKAAAGATIVSVNGVRHVLEPGGFFPASDPVFVLVSEQPAAKTVVVGLRGGEYANGGRRTKLTVGRPIVVVNTTTRARYRLLLVTAGDGKPKATGTRQP